MGSGPAQPTWTWGQWKALGLPLRPLEQPMEGAILVVFDGGPDARTGPLIDPGGAHPVLRALIDQARAATPSVARVLPAAVHGYAAVVFVPVTNEELAPLVPLADRFHQPETVVVLPASDALRLGVAPSVLAAWLRRGLSGGSGIVVLAVSDERDLARLDERARTRAPEGLKGLFSKPLGTATTRAALFGALAAGGLGVAAWIDQKITTARAQDRSGLGTFRPRSQTGVSRLASILLEELAEKPREALVREARGRTRRGDSLAVVEEWLHEHPDPARILAGHFAAFELAPLARKHLNLDLHGLADGREMAERILGALGLTAQAEDRGLHAALSQTRSFRERLEAGTITPRSVVELGATLERITKCMLGFHLRFAFDTKTARNTLYGRILESPGAPASPARHQTSLDSMTLGELSHALDVFDHWRVHGKETKARERHANLYRQRGPDAPGLRQLAKWRNGLSHDRKGPPPHEIAPQFLLGAELWLTHLRSEKFGARLYPALVQVESVKLDGSEPLVFGVDDEGRQEQLRPGRTLEVGTVWYMVPRSNPVRVRPVLVPAE